MRPDTYLVTTGVDEDTAEVLHFEPLEADQSFLGFKRSEHCQPNVIHLEYAQHYDIGQDRDMLELVLEILDSMQATKHGVQVGMGGRGSRELPAPAT